MAEKEHQCSKCTQKFYSIRDRGQYMTDLHHTFTCNVLNYECDFSSDINEKMEIAVHLKNIHDLYNCLFCGTILKSGAEEHGFLNHMVIKHRNVLIDNTSQEHQFFTEWRKRVGMN